MFSHFQYIYNQFNTREEEPWIGQNPKMELHQLKEEFTCPEKISDVTNSFLLALGHL